jgi:hypothetical protein
VRLRFARPEAKQAGSIGAVAFRGWRPGAHTIWFRGMRNGRFDAGELGSVDYDVIDAAGKRKASGSKRLHTEHAQSGETFWVELSRIELRREVLGAYTLRAQYNPAAEAISGASILIRKNQRDVGMGGLINYVLALPGVVLGILAVLLAVPVARRTRIPFWATPVAFAAAATLLGPASFLVGA